MKPAAVAKRSDVSIGMQMACELAVSLLQREPSKRPTARAALAHPFFGSLTTATTPAPEPVARAASATTAVVGKRKNDAPPQRVLRSRSDGL